jgi:acyl carrier protein
MNDIDSRLLRCFRAVFPDLDDGHIRSAVQGGTDQWDSLASMLLARTIEEEFGIEADLAMLERLNSFDEVRAYVSRAN